VIALKFVFAAVVVLALCGWAAPTLVSSSSTPLVLLGGVAFLIGVWFAIYTTLELANELKMVINKEKDEDNG
jgi:hypothetical protein